MAVGRAAATKAAATAMEALKWVGRLGMGGRKAAIAGISIGASTMRGARGAHCHRIC